MAKIQMKKFVPAADEVAVGATPMDKMEILEALTKYKAQNPKKYEAKKAALFAHYGLTLEEEPVPVPDESDKEIEALKEAVAKKASRIKKAE